jgi:diguanylate cyclase
VVPVPAPARPSAPLRLRGDTASLEDAFRRAAVIHAALLKLSSLEMDGLDTRAYRATVDGQIAVLEGAMTAAAVRDAVRLIATAAQDYLRTQQELLDTREAEFTETVTLLTEAVVRFKESNSDFTEQMLDRSDRMVETLAIDDLRMLRARLSDELNALREATIAKQRADAEQIDSLSSRVEALEIRLALAVAQANRDPLTGLENRAAWEQRLAELTVQLDQGQEAYALALIDLDHFKQINDTRGHAAGDAALVDFAELCRQGFGSDDFVARYGGDEFAVLLAAPTPEHAVDHIERLMVSVRKANLTLRRQGDRPAFTVSAGLAHASRHLSAQDLLARADAALYAAKQEGRNRLVVAPAA